VKKSRAEYQRARRAVTTDASAVAHDDVPAALPASTSLTLPATSAQNPVKKSRAEYHRARRAACSTANAGDDDGIP
jgi:D-aminopeptidase